MHTFLFCQTHRHAVVLTHPNLPQPTECSVLRSTQLPWVSSLRTRPRCSRVEVVACGKGRDPRTPNILLVLLSESTSVHGLEQKHKFSVTHHVELHLRHDDVGQDLSSSARCHNSTMRFVGGASGTKFETNSFMKLRCDSREPLAPHIRGHMACYLVSLVSADGGRSPRRAPRGTSVGKHLVHCHGPTGAPGAGVLTLGS